MQKRPDPRVSRAKNLIAILSRWQALQGSQFGNDEELKEIGFLTMCFTELEESIAQHSREIDRVTKDEYERGALKRATQEWRDRHIRRVVDKVSGELIVQTCAAVEGLLNRVPPGTDLTARVDEIIYTAMRPVRRREDQGRAIEQATSQLRAGARQSELECRVRSQVTKAGYSELPFVSAM